MSSDIAHTSGTQLALSVVPALLSTCIIQRENDPAPVTVYHESLHVIFVLA
jgi:hypothetical protein